MNIKQFKEENYHLFLRSEKLFLDSNVNLNRTWALTNHGYTIDVTMQKQFS